MRPTGEGNVEMLNRQQLRGPFERVSFSTKCSFRKKREVTVFISVIIPLNNPARRPIFLFLASKENEGALLLPWEKNLFGLRKWQHRIKE